MHHVNYHFFPCCTHLTCFIIYYHEQACLLSNNVTYQSSLYQLEYNYIPDY